MEQYRCLAIVPPYVPDDLVLTLNAGTADVIRPK
jgi:hypothetical protein